MKASTKRMIKKVKSLNYKKMDKIVDIISQESHKSKFYIKLDMFINFWTTGCGYTDYFRGNFINLNRAEKKLLQQQEIFIK